MEIWLRLGNDVAPVDQGEATHYLSDTPRSDRMWVDGERLMDGDNPMGAYLMIRDGEGQHQGVALMGSVDWILVECETWSMIPLENLLAAREGSHTKLAAVIRTPTEAQGAGFALDIGVDALVVDNHMPLFEAALSVQSQRGEHIEEVSENARVETESIDLQTLTVVSVEEAGVGDRYCLDLLSLLSQGEGLLIGSSASALVLVHSETIPSTFVPTRPFRVNAGAPHGYVLMADGSTKYLSELVAGDRLLAVSVEGETRSVGLGRLKIEQRPMLKITAEDTSNNKGKPNKVHVFMQQAETVRLVADSGKACSVTSIDRNQDILGWTDRGARHLGRAISSPVEER